MILYKSKTDLLSTLIVRETNKIFQKGKFIQYLDKDQNFWSVLFETEGDLEEALRLLEERCTIERLTLIEKMPPLDDDEDNEKQASNGNENHNNHVLNEGENYVKDKEGEDDVAASIGTGTTNKINNTTSEKACETDSATEDKTKQLKSNILTRMAKMGKRIVSPSRKLTTTNTELSDSSDPEVSPRRKAQQHQQSPQRPHTTQNSPALQVAKLQPGPIAHSIEFSNFMRPPPSSALVNHHSSGPTSASDSSLNLMLMQNTEIRFNLSKLDSKLEKLCDKIESMSANSVAATIASKESNNNSARGSGGGVDEDIVRMEEKLLVMKRENINLKSIIRNLEDKLNEPPDTELNELKIKLKTAQLENKNISLELNNKNEKIHLLEAKMKASRDERDVEFSNLEVELNDLKSQLASLQVSLDKVRQQRENSLTIETQTEQETTVAFSEASIKEIMNNLYFKLCEKISSTSDMKQSEVLKIIGQTIKQETSECLKKHVK